MQEQFDDYFNDFSSKFLCGFRQHNEAQNCLLAMIEKLRKIRDEEDTFATVLADLSKAFNYNHS